MNNGTDRERELIVARDLGFNLRIGRIIETTKGIITDTNRIGEKSSFILFQPFCSLISYTSTVSFNLNIRTARDTITPTSVAAIPMASKAITPPVDGEDDNAENVSRNRRTELNITSADKSIRNIFLLFNNPYTPIANTNEARIKKA
ncbi:MAG: hypothetical protein NWE86_03230 [Candidatus Bathyarchaeota archaeon]|nr:hypothetical protein [Candidatus Bathyarchaeota archaeon]